MMRSIPLPAVLLFLFLLNLVHSLDNTYRHSIDTLFRREDYTDFTDIDASEVQDSTDEDGDEPTPVKTRVKGGPTVTTIIIIQTTGGQTYNELGSGGSTGTATNADPNNGDGEVDPNDEDIQAKGDQDDSALKRMISIPTVVGGIAIAAIIAGAFVFFRLRAKRRRTKALRLCQELSSSDLRGNEGGTGTDYNGGHQRQQSNLSTATYASHHHHLQPLSPLSPPDNRDFSANVMPSVVPSAPLEPTILPTHLRERRMLSTLSQQLAPNSPPLSSTAPPLPSAPSTKELEMNAPSTPATVSCTNVDLQPSSSNCHHRHPSSLSTSSPSPSTASVIPSSHSKSTDETQMLGDISSPQLSSTPDLPPPAYSPSAPPLFSLPPNRRRRSADQLSLDRYRRS
ncbi:hypothetical protein BCR42DRAFT_226238 [Absidia repens]|uniref:Mid2 domain-containing protein n=1 Tax=Absidia repens TaxID=90262 RepID=A0A1X2IPG3_9FUNG|nr:hypothetical protein BCR42DRAFT_226238 [Absidia repens]